MIGTTYNHLAIPFRIPHERGKANRNGNRLLVRGLETFLDMQDRPPGTILLIAAVLTATLLMYGLGGYVIVVQLLIFAVGTPVFVWFEIEGEENRPAKVVRIVAITFWSVAISLLATLLLYEACFELLPSARLRSLLVNSMFSVGIAGSSGFASFAVLERRVHTSWKKLLGLIGAVAFSYFVNREFEFVEIMIVPAITLIMLFCFRCGEVMSSACLPLLHEVAPIYQRLRKMGSGVAVFVVGYMCIIVFFTGAYAAVERVNPSSFGGSGVSGKDEEGKKWQDRSLSRFLHLSVATGTTLGYGDIYPTKPLSRLTTSAQVLVSLGWTIIVFVAATNRASEDGEVDSD